MLCASVLDHRRRVGSLETCELQDFCFLNKVSPLMKTAKLEARGRLKILLLAPTTYYGGVADVFALANRFVFQRFGTV